jgi:glucosyl-dolichyl phosphate glucuronosyltransferase
MEVLFSAIIVTYRRPAALRRALTALKEQNYKQEDWEVVVVDNDSERAHLDPQRVCMESGLSNLRYVREPETGLAHARNRGIKEARGRYLIFLDDDAVASPNWLAAYAEAYRQNPSAKGAGGPVRVCWEKERPRWLREAEEGWYAKVDWGNEIVPLSYPRFPRGANMSFQKDLSAELGGFIQEIAYSAKDKTLVAMDEAYFFDRIFRAGHLVIYVPNAFVEHWIDEERATFRYLLSRSRFQAVGDWRFFKHSPDFNFISAAARVAVRMAGIVSSLVFYAATIPLSRDSQVRALARIKLAYNYGYIVDAFGCRP